MSRRERILAPSKVRKELLSECEGSKEVGLYASQCMAKGDEGAIIRYWFVSSDGRVERLIRHAYDVTRYEIAHSDDGRFFNYWFAKAYAARLREYHEQRNSDAQG